MLYKNGIGTDGEVKRNEFIIFDFDFYWDYFFFRVSRIFSNEREEVKRNDRKGLA